MASNKLHKRKEAMDTEINCILFHNTWKLVGKLDNANTSGTIWNSKIKTVSDGTKKYKAILVAQGFNQVYGAYYQEIFAPVARYAIIRLLFAFAVKNDLGIRHLDVKSAFFHSKIKDLYQPPGYESPYQKEEVCKLNKALYGLKQASRSWDIKLQGIFITMGFKKSKSDPSLYYLRTLYG